MKRLVFLLPVFSLKEPYKINYIAGKLEILKYKGSGGKSWASFRACRYLKNQRSPSFGILSEDFIIEFSRFQRNKFLLSQPYWMSNHLVHIFTTSFSWHYVYAYEISAYLTFRLSFASLYYDDYVIMLLYSGERKDKI